MISSLAHVSPEARIGDNVIIEPFAVIHPDVIIGDGTHIMSHAVIADGSRIGMHCKIFPGAVVSAIPQDLKFAGETTTAEIGDHTTLRECVTVNRGTKDKWKTIVGSHCLLMAYSHVAHDCILGNYVIIANGTQLAGHVEIGDHAILGGLAGVQQFTRIGAYSYVGAQTLARKDVPPYVKAARDPMSYMGVNIVGLHRRGFSKETITEISNIYHILFVEKHNTSAAINLVETNCPPSPIKDQILEFLKGSRIGIIKRQSKNGSDDDFAF